MRRITPLAVAVFLTGCATIFGGGTNQNVNLSANTAATYTVKSSSGLQMAQGNVGGSVRLPRKNEYQIEIQAPGYQTQNIGVAKGMNGWFWANLLLGGIVGMAIDAASGAMWKLEPATVSVSLAKVAGDEDGLYSRVQFFDKNGKLLGEKLTKLEPAY